MDPTFALKSYQQDALNAVRKWLAEAADSGDADTAFYRATKRPYQPVADLPGVPYACLRLPTGGGKTLLAAHAIGLAADAFLKTDAPVALWLVPSNAIREQTLETLKDRAHPYRRALAERFGENVRVMTVAEALYAKRPDYDGGAVVIVATLQAFRVTETEGRKVYDPNGELMDHFSGLTDAQVRLLEKIEGSGPPIPSLCNVLKLRRPMVIVDEAHNARTDLSFATLARLAPSLILELTATPAADSNVLHHVSAAELKAADMIKLPIVLRGRPDWKETVRDARSWLETLTDKARAEEARTGEFIRPVMLLQAQPNSAAGDRITVEVLKKALIEDFQVPADEIALATGDYKELEGVDLSDRSTKIRYIITVAALREGWDCPNAYILCSVAEQHGSTAVQQILGRVMRLPKARRKTDEDLNQAYAFSATRSFQDTAKALAEGLVANGFEKIEARELVRQAPSLPGLEDIGAVYFSDPIPDDIDLEPIRATVAATTGGRVTVNPATRRLETAGGLSEQDAKTLLLSVPATLAKTLEGFVKQARTPPPPPIVALPGFSVPTLCVQRGGSLELFGREHFLDLPWRLQDCDASAILEAFSPPAERVDEAHLDVSDAGKIGIEFIQDLNEQLSLAVGDRGWDYPALVRWLDRRLAPTTRQDVTQASSLAFIRAALDALMSPKGGYALDRLARLRFRLVDTLARLISGYRDARQTQAFEACLFGGALSFRTASDHAVTFSAESYFVDGRHRYAGRHRFPKHLRPDQIGEMNNEEEQCALALELNPKVKRWVRNLERRPTSFRLATSSDWFYPDFVAELTDGRFLAVEYKGGHLAGNDDTAEKELVGRKWAEASGGTCVFVMARDRDFGAVERAVG
ncbi:MAG: DEAD/DEAH box helicase [Caulobacter sp.]